ncbi:pyruvate dehydrogenase phosphatase regulatory subunit, mitochondrial-like [Macrosteles quadrilineatus]|uniref:pyruvate dehydrogenase phosphatase regulatory subunit, mitochondrial-like n=1 Tax=Macrosteles quadrilineatus TaxID=74068 RepID=UPI0023E2D97A|nr:pyruvate dehydrogenase phosphatase regulatory subunit, mitochondrial-like [Macrosteles quadrilineatus]
MFSLSQLSSPWLKSSFKVGLLKPNKRKIYDDLLIVLTNNLHLPNDNGFLRQCSLPSVISNDTLPFQARVVICGAGVVANSVAYHLVQNGWNDIVVVEQGSICGGTSHFGSGTLGLFKPLAEKNIIWNSVHLYQKLQDDGYNLDLRRVGSLNLAQTKDRLIFLKRRMSCHTSTGLQCELLGPNELKRLHPYLYTEDLEGAVWVPGDATCNPKAICHTLASLANQGGAQYVENCTVEKVLSKNGRVEAVVTSLGTIKCEKFVNCAGMWARDLGQRCLPKVRVPAYPVQHFLVTTEELGGLPPPDTLPYVRDYDSQTYIRQFGGGFMVGGFEKNAKAAFVDTKIPRDWQGKLAEDWNHFSPLWEAAQDRIPFLKNSRNPVLTNAPDNFTPNGKWILGEAPEVDNYFVAVGMNGNSLQGAGGIGKAVADWIVEGTPTQELLPFEVNRFVDLHNNRQYLQQRVVEIVERHYAIEYPTQSEYQTGRRLRCSPLYSVLETRGAVFGVRMGYERPLYFDTTCKTGKPPKMPEGTYYKPRFFDFMVAEHLACREGVGIIDMSSFSKIEIKSTERKAVVEYLQKMCSNDVDIPVGGIVHTGMQNERGGYENDCIMVRQTENSYFMVSPTSQQTRIYEWMRRNLPSGSPVVLNDVTSMYTVINMAGPKSRALLSELSNTEFRIKHFTCKKVDVGYASDVMVMALTHTGEPGYCLYVPSEYALHVYDRLINVGRDYGARDVGVLTQRFLRIEKFIPLWAEDLTSLTTPLEAGSNLVSFEKPHFIGREALLRQRERGVTQRLVMLELEDIDPDKDIWPWGNEPIYRNHQYCGTVTSAGYGFNIQKLICLGFVRCMGEIVSTDYITDPSAVYHIDIAGNRVRCKAHVSVPQIIGLDESNDDVRQYRPKVVTSVVS